MTSPPIVARCWTLAVEEGTVDVALHCADETPLAEVLSGLRDALGVPVPGLWSGSTRLPADVTLTAAELRHGAVLGVGRPTPRAWHAQPSSAVELHVVGGPDAGRVVPLSTGEHLLGRGSEAALRLEDPDVSRRHATIGVGAAGLTVADAGSTNGSRLGDQELDPSPRPWPTGAVLRIGASSLAVTTAARPAATAEVVRGGRLRLRPTAGLRTVPPEMEVAFPAPPSSTPRRRLAWVAIALPAVGGLLMAWLLHAPTFLFFALLSPVVALGTWVSERWSGRRSRRQENALHDRELAAAEVSLSAAVQAHRRTAEAAAPDLAALTTAARRRSHLLWCRSADTADTLTVRIGTGPGPTRVTRLLSGGERVREFAPHLPVVVELPDSGGLGVVGPRERATGVLRSVVAQVVTLHAPGHVDLLVLTEQSRLAEWTWARWLPHLPPTSVHVRQPDATDEELLLRTRLQAEVARRRAAVERSGRPATRWLLVLVDRMLPPQLAALLDEARGFGVLVLTAASTVAGQPVPPRALLRLGGETGDTGVLSRSGYPDQEDIVVDRLPLVTAAALSRDLAAVTPAATPGALPPHMRLLELPGPGLRLTDQRADEPPRLLGAWSSRRDRLVATLGRSADGPVVVDLCRDGPHALVAGTTGSGKSELLQTLIASLALAHPPDRCSFLLIDYKGGAAFGPAARLPHTVGLVTDLDRQSTARALRSLAAELTRREAVLAAHAKPDVVDLPADADLGRLVIVVDEFATLAEELPEFVPGLISIAQRGRSLGVHLVLATQRPAGAVSPEIRANCSLRICLRTTDETDSRDVLGIPDAAHLPVDLPGRALLRSGNAPAVPFQTARIAGPRPGTDPEAPAVTRWSWPGLPLRPTEPHRGQESDLDLLTAAVSAHTELHHIHSPHRPWRPPLPDSLSPDDLAMLAPWPDGPREVLRIGMVDRPDQQTQEPLELDLDTGGTWLAVGGPRSGRTTLLRTVFAEAVHRFGPGELHVHVLAAGASRLTQEATDVPHVGTVVADQDALRTVRLVDRLLQDIARRRSGTGPAAPGRLLLLVDGLEAISAVLDDGDPTLGSAALLRLARDGAAAGLTCVMTADRAAPGGRVAAVARERLVLPLTDRADYAVAGVPSRAVPGHRPPGRALLGEDALECQLVLPRDLGEIRHHAPPPGNRPLRIAELPADPELPLPVGARLQHPPGTLVIPLGPGGDGGETLTVDLVRGGGLLVTGPPRSGRSSTLVAVAAHLYALGVPLLWLGRPPTDAPAAGDVLDPADAAGVSAWRAGLAQRTGAAQPTGVVLADDVGAAAEWGAFAALAGPPAGQRVALVAASSAGLLSGHYQGPVATLRRDRCGLLLCPGPGDGDLLGIRLPRLPLPARPGSGWLATGGLVQRVQVARRPHPVDPASNATAPSST